jgi:hypothetical protein
MQALQTVLLQCPYCWETVELFVDCSVPEQQIVEDCSVCCSPILITLTLDEDDELYAEARMENG